MIEFPTERNVLTGHPVKRPERPHLKRITGSRKVRRSRSAVAPLIAASSTRYDPGY